MPTFILMDYAHTIEYHLRREGGELELAYTENVQDHGWYIRKEPDWKQRYTYDCAVDFLERVEAKSGTYAVAVFRDGARVITVGLEWKRSIR